MHREPDLRTPKWTCSMDFINGPVGVRLDKQENIGQDGYTFKVD